MAAAPESVLIACHRCRAWPMAIHARSHPKQGTLPTVLICKRCGHKVDGPTEMMGSLLVSSEICGLAWCWNGTERSRNYLGRHCRGCGALFAIRVET